MNPKDKFYCENVLKYLCVGGQVGGIRFGAAPQLLINNSEENLAVRGQIYLNVSSRWCFFNSLPLVMPETKDELRELSEDEELIELCKLRYKTIKNISLTEHKPNLIIEFEDNTIFFMNGFDEKYESWDMGVAFTTLDQPWQVIALPGGDITAFIPKQYKDYFNR